MGPDRVKTCLQPRIPQYPVTVRAAAMRIFQTRSLRSNQIAHRRDGKAFSHDLGHQDAFLRPRLSVWCRFSQGTFARTRGNWRDAPNPGLPGLTPERGSSTQGDDLACLFDDLVGAGDARLSRRSRRGGRPPIGFLGQASPGPFCTRGTQGGFASAFAAKSMTSTTKSTLRPTRPNLR